MVQYTIHSVPKSLYGSVRLSDLKWFAEHNLLTQLVQARKKKLSVGSTEFGQQEVMVHHLKRGTDINKIQQRDYYRATVVRDQLKHNSLC